MRADSIGRPVALVLVSMVVTVTTTIAQDVPSATVGPPPGAPSVEEHVARAIEVLGTPSPARAGDSSGFLELARTLFTPPFLPDYAQVAFEDGVVYGVDSHDRLVAVDARNGEDLGWSRLGQYGTSPIALGVDPSGRRVALRGATRWAYGDPAVQTWDVSDPSAPVELGWSEPCGTDVLLLAHATLGLTWGEGCANLIDVSSQRVFHDFGDRVEDANAMVVDDRPFVIIRTYAGLRRDSIRAYDVGDPSHPRVKWVAEIDSYSTLTPDPAGRVVVVASYSAVTIRSAIDGAVLGSLPDDAASRFVVIAGTEARPVLVVGREDGLRLFDIAIPTAPREVSPLVPAPVLGSGGRPPFARQPLVALGGSSWVAAQTVDPVGVTVVDANDGSIVAEYRIENEVVPVALVWTRLEDGAPAFFWTVRFQVEDRTPRPAGGRLLADTVSLADPAMPARVARYAPVVPSEIQDFVPVGGRHVVVVDLSSNAILLVDPTDGTVLDARGSESGLYAARKTFSGREGRAVASGRTVAIGDGQRFEVFEIANDRLHPRPLSDPGESLWKTPIAVLPDGTVVTSGGIPEPVLATHRPDGSSGRVELPFAAYSLVVDPAGERAVGAVGSVWAGADSPSFAVDLGDRLNPRLLWTRDDGALFATFVRGGRAVALTKHLGWGYAPFLHDPETGEPLGEPVDAAYPFYYFGPVVASGEGDDARLSYWQWTFCCWQSVLFDVSTDEPTRVASSGEYIGVPTGMARDDGRRAYEFRNSTYIVDPDVGFAPFDQKAVIEGDRLRHGFLVAMAPAPYSGRPAPIVVLRDPALNRSPVANSGGDATYECDDRQGTPVSLDGSASSDPDSTPGTEDDLSSFAWSIDGVATDEGATVETTLAIGPHEVRLAVADVLGATGEDVAAVDVRDTRPPEVTVSLRPEIVAGNLRTRNWVPEVAADDRCDGSLVAETMLGLDREVLDAPASWTLAGAPAIEIVDGRAGLEVRLLGSERPTLEAVWARAREEDGLRVPPGPLELSLEVDPPRGGSRATFAVYALDSEGRVVVATAYGEGADHRIAARATDLAGNRAEATASLRSTIATLCAEAPSSVECR